MNLLCLYWVTYHSEILAKFKRLLPKLFPRKKVIVALALVSAFSALSSYALLNRDDYYREHARRSKVKSTLYGISVAQQDHYQNYGTYTSCLKELGFETTSKTHFLIGFSEKDKNRCGASGDLPCNRFYKNGKFESCSSSSQLFTPPKVFRLSKQKYLTESKIKKNSFLIFAIGKIEPSKPGSYEKWSINHRGSLKLVENYQGKFFSKQKMDQTILFLKFFGFFLFPLVFFKACRQLWIKA